MMKLLRFLAIGAIALGVMIPLASAQNPFDDSSMRRETAARISQNHGVSVNWQQTSLLEIMDIEARLNAVKRISQDHGVKFDWQKTALLELMDIEARLNAVRRISRDHGVQFDWQKTSLLTLMDAEGRMNAAKRISNATKQPVDWKKHTLLELMETEARLSGVDVDALRKRAAQRSAAGEGAPAPSGAAMESKVDGEFNGWEGETIVKLMNGQIWQQTEYYYYYSYAYMPDVLIYNAGGGWKMKVEGVDKAVSVQRLK